MNVAIIYGGKSCENEISVITGCLARGYFGKNVYSIYLDKNNRCFIANGLSPKQHTSGKLRRSVVFLTGEGGVGVVRHGRMQKIKIDVAVNCCHGMCGEDGCVAALCKMCGIPLVGADIASAAISMDKALCKQYLRTLRFPVLPSVTVDAATRTDDILHKLKLPIVVKPCRLGSSIGVSVCHTEQQLSDALQVALTYDSYALCERALDNFIELNCAAMRVQGLTRTSRVEVPHASGELLSFADKYLQGAKQGETCSSLRLQRRVRALTQAVYEKMHFNGVIRVDYLLDNTTDKLYVNEVNSTPGSLSYGLWQGEYSRTEFGSALVEQALADAAKTEALVTSFPSQVLDGNFTKK